MRFNAFHCKNVVLNEPGNASRWMNT